MGTKEILLTGAPDRALAPSEFPVAYISGFSALRLALRMRHDRLGVLSALQPHADVVVLQAGWKRLVFVFNAALARELLSEHQHAQEKGLGLADAHLLFGKGLLTATADSWHRQRRRMAKAFNASALPASLDAMATMVRRQRQAWGPEATPVSARELAIKLALGTVAMAQFDTEFDQAQRDWLSERLAVLCHLTQQRMTCPVNLPLSWPTPEHRRAHAARRDLRAWARHQVARVGDPEHLSQHAVLATLKAQGEEDDEQLVDEALTVLMAGHETVAATISWAMLYLATHPQVQQRLYEHTQALSPDASPAQAVREASYALAVVEETLRLQPPVWMITRRPTDSQTLGSLHVASGTDVLVPVWALHRDPNVWERAECFEPQRFLDPIKRSATASAYLPFGAGPRLCIGRRQGLGESVLALSELVRHFHITPIGASADVPHWPSEQGLTLLPSPELRVQLRPR